MKTDCIVFPEPNKVMIGTVDMGTPGRGRVLTRTRLTGVSTGTETRVFRGKQDHSEFPLIPGYENLGEVIETGPGTTLPVGARLFVRNHEYDPTPYNRVWGSQVARSISPESSAIPVPDAVPDEHAIYAKVCGIALHGVRRARVHEGEWIVVVGLGMIGHLVVQQACVRGARVIGVDVDEARLNLATRAGAVHAIDGRGADVAEQVWSLTGGGADVGFDATGLASTIERTAACLRHRPWDAPPESCSRLVLQGSLEEPLILNYYALFMPELDVIAPRDCDTQDIVDSLALMESGSIRPGIIPVSVYSYRDAEDAYTRLVNREIMRVHFRWD